MPDPCHCGHDLGDHVMGDAGLGLEPCDVFGCACDDFQADGVPWDCDAPYDRDEAAANDVYEFGPL